LATIGQMAAKVSHEVRNPLGSISLNAELLEDELRSLPEAQRAEAATLLAAIRSQVDVLGAVTEEYLRFARLPKPKLEAAALGPLLEELAEFVRGELRRRGVDVSLHVPNGLPTLSLDPGQMRQAFLNLVRNAAEAMPEGGRITLEARAQASGVEIAVSDTGMGIPEAIRDKIFDPFFTTKDAGTGLGLAIARQIAVDHGGSLVCESGPGVGTTFRLNLPTRAEEGNP
jgi:signal transduction histidine kinase